MALLLRDLVLDVDADEEQLPILAARQIGLEVHQLSNFRVIRRSVDARNKRRVVKVYTVAFSCIGEDALLQRQVSGRLEPMPESPAAVFPRVPGAHHVLVVGMGPAGLFAAKRLAEAGVRVTLAERGRMLEKRVRDVENFWATGRLDMASNVQFGEGGAGTFSDGKLTTRLNHPQRQQILETLVACGAPQEILVEAHPHVGSDRLRKVVINFRRLLTGLGVDIRFESCMTGLEMCRGRVVGGVVNEDETLRCDSLVLAPGHSARDTYLMLDRSGVHLEAKGFAVGVRVEHPAGLINRIQYGKFAHQLPPAEYALRYNDDESGRGIYSFCMCPGGEVINAASEPGGLVVNGMSRMSRSARHSNSALVVSVGPPDWGGARLGGMAFQQHWERQAFMVGGADYRVPAQNLLAFLGRGDGPVTCSCRPGVSAADLGEVLPDFVYHGLRRALPYFDRKMKGFITAEAVLIGVETRTSAPLRITRGDSGESISHAGLFPAGEGAGYAGGIMSAALDGLRAADQVIRSVPGMPVL